MKKNKEVRILIVDDEETIRKLLAHHLEASYDCVTASSVEEAMKLLTVSAFNLVMTDIKLPGASGIELCNFINASYPETVVVIVSGFTDDQMLNETNCRGVFDLIAKPFNLSHVSNVVERALQHQASRGHD